MFADVFAEIPQWVPWILVRYSTIFAGGANRLARRQLRGLQAALKSRCDILAANCMHCQHRMG